TVTNLLPKSFIEECNALRNVSSYPSACSSIDSEGNDFKALIYKFMPNGDMHKVLYSTRGDENSSNLNHITVVERLSIVVDVADALEYLHHNSQETIVHCDLKPSNILLDENMIAHLGTLDLQDSKWPQVCGGGQVSTAADVYSFGVVLIEIFF
ncbi:hypothetical protein U9M48_004893, partial [Paspalum notatum var. saurae]